MRSYHMLCLLLIMAISSCQKQEERLTMLVDYVNPFIGTDGPGNTYPGATVPYGMVQLSPDIGIPGWDRIAGYYYQDSIITGFSHTHLTGTGAGDLYDILVMPTNSRSNDRMAENNFKPYSKYSHDQEEAAPGYYSVYLLDYGIKAEMTATKHVGIHRYTFPSDSDSKIHVDLGYALNWDKPTETYIEKVNDSTIHGYRFSTGWARNQKIFFHMEFSRPFTKSSYFLNDTLSVYPLKGEKTKIVLDFTTAEGEEIIVKTGISTTSSKAAQKAIAVETLGFDFDYHRQRAMLDWEKQLSKIKIETTDADKKSIFYTMLYQSMLAPTLLSDVHGTYKAANDEHGNYKEDVRSIAVAEGFERYDTFSLWDTFRAAHPLYTIIHPEKIPDFVNSLLAHYKETGELPVWSMQASETNMMIGYHAVPVIVDAYFKGFDFDAELAYEACVASANAMDREIPEYIEQGYIAVGEHHENWSVSKTMEYAYDDWCIAMFAKAMDKQTDYEHFLERSKSWQHLYNEKTSWIQPKNTEGEFLPNFIAKEYTPYFCESNAWHYYWFVPQDVETLMEKTGGQERFAQKLDSMFTFYPEPEDKLPLFSTGMIGQYAHGNEPSHHVAYLYNYVKQPSKAQRLVREILEGQYINQPDGHCGNEDCGQMSSWYILSSLGFYPVNPAQGVYLLGAPLFDKAEVKVGNDLTFTILANELSKENKYVKSIALNGEPLKRFYLTHKEITTGGTLEFEMTNVPSDDGFKDFELPKPDKVY